MDIKTFWTKALPVNPAQEYIRTKIKLPLRRDSEDDGRPNQVIPTWSLGRVLRLTLSRSGIFLDL